VYFLDVSWQTLRFEAHALGRAYHAAHVRLGARASGSDLHGHADFYELMGILAGRGEQRVDSGVQPLAAGDLVLIRPRDRHAITGLPPRGLAFVNVAFPAAGWRGFVDLTGVDPHGSWERGRRPPRVCLSGASAAAMRATFRRALGRFQGTPSTLDLVRFWSDVVELFGPPGEQVGPEPASPRSADGHAIRPAWLVRARAAMRREANLRDGLPRLLALANVSPAHLSRTMRVHYDVSPTTFVADLRLEHAAALLATTDLTVTEIAHRCGFSSQSYFTRRFREAHRTPPREFRAQARRAFVP
jgi:AraC family transcriptional regulator, dual regulator of chb operon